MPLNEATNEELTLILEALEPEIKGMDPTPANFVGEQVEKHARYGRQLFISDKQLAWLRRLYVQYVGPIEHLPLTTRGARDDTLGNDDGE